MLDVAMVALSIVPPLMSAVVNTDDASVTTPVESAIDPAEVPSLAFRFVTSRAVVSTVGAATTPVAVKLPVVRPKVNLMGSSKVPSSRISRSPLFK